ncbi:Acyl-coa--sterol o-acyltransferase [Thalictrum thalictroides]|uniref:Acyl-coa--sterol o-acyltransferase n=1 Tax=Thalictrum thalictroides TaxID=46969 RepID=A0A7J6W5G3_THATH|nr:Acyl-coa--sterol o-acyltransferase [Thalictrum thalictroides]
MDGDAEFRAFIKVWCSAFAYLTYCYVVSFKIPQGKLRLVSLLPIFYIFTILPANLTTVSLGGMTAFFLSWLANFKLFLFSFGQGPLSLNPSISFSQFISIACLPIKIKYTQNPSPQNNKKPTSPHIEKPATNNKLSTKGPKSNLNYAVKVLVIGLLCVIYEHKQYLHSKFMLAYYCCFMYLGLELVLAIVAALAKRFVGLEFEPQFNEPYLATSLQDFWGRRWNLMVSNILKPTVYDLVKQVSMKMLGNKLATSLAVFSTFVASGLIHEMIYYYLLRETPTWEVTCFFILHGILVVLEILVKKAMKDRWRLHPVVSWAYTVFILMATGNWLFFPQLLRANTDVRISMELLTLLDFCKDLARSIGIFSF